MCMSLCATLAGAQPMAAADGLKPMAWLDQFERPVAVDEGTRVVILVSDKAVSEWVNPILSEMPADTLTRLKAVYVSDISAMPALITKAFALPKLRKLPFQIALARDAAEVPHWPRQPGAATWLRLQGRQVQSVQYLLDAEQLKKAMAAVSP